MTRAAQPWSLECLLAMALSVTGCVGDAERSSPRAGADTTPTVFAPATDGTPEMLLRAALARLVRGESAKSTWFSAATAHALRSVSVDPSGHAIVDFEDLRALIPNASSSAGSGMLLDELNATVFGVDNVRSVEYRIEGRCERFWEWLQRGCETVRRPDPSAAPVR